MRQALIYSCGYKGAPGWHHGRRATLESTGRDPLQRVGDFVIEDEDFEAAERHLKEREAQVRPRFETEMRAVTEECEALRKRRMENKALQTHLHAVLFPDGEEQEPRGLYGGDCQGLQEPRGLTIFQLCYGRSPDSR